VRGGDDADVHAERSRAAEPFDAPLLEDAQQLDLDVGRQIADFVEEDRGAIRQLEPPFLPGHGAREGPLLATEQLALEERGRDRGAVDSYHRTRARWLCS